MPTVDDMQELIDNTTYEWVENYNNSGVNGGLLTSNINGNTLFFPASGYRQYSDVTAEGEFGYPWSSVLRSDHLDNAWFFAIGDNNIDIVDEHRQCGQPVRGVHE